MSFKYCLQASLRIFPSPGASTGSKSRKFSDFQKLYSERRLGISSTLRTYMEETIRRVTPRTSLRSVLLQQAVFEGGSSKFF